jgi:hypothetical protein
MTTWTGEVVFDDEIQEYMIVFPPELTAQLGWKVGDTLAMTLTEDQSILIKKIAS